MQISAGTVALTNGQATVTGTETDWVGKVLIGMAFKRAGEATVYTVASNAVQGSGVQTFTLTAPYSGTNGSGLPYYVSTGFTPNCGLTEIDFGDVDWPVLLTSALRKIDSSLPPGLPGVYARLFPSFTACVTDPSTAGKRIILDTVMPVTNNLGITNDRHIEVIPGGGLNISINCTVQFYGTVKAGFSQWIFGAGKVYLFATPIAYPQWWGGFPWFPGGAIADQTAAINAAMAASFGGGGGGITMLSKGKWYVRDLQLQWDNQLIGEGMLGGVTTLSAHANFPPTSAVVVAKHPYATVKHLQIDSAGIATGLDMTDWNSWCGELERVMFTNPPAGGYLAKLSGSNGGRIQRCYFSGPAATYAEAYLWVDSAVGIAIENNIFQDGSSKYFMKVTGTTQVESAHICANYFEANASHSQRLHAAIFNDSYASDIHSNYFGCGSATATEGSLNAVIVGPNSKNTRIANNSVQNAASFTNQYLIQSGAVGTVVDHNNFQELSNAISDSGTDTIISPSKTVNATYGFVMSQPNTVNGVATDVPILKLTKNNADIGAIDIFITIQRGYKIQSRKVQLSWNNPGGCAIVPINAPYCVDTLEYEVATTSGTNWHFTSAAKAVLNVDSSITIILTLTQVALLNDKYSIVAQVNIRERSNNQVPAAITALL